MENLRHFIERLRRFIGRLFKNPLLLPKKVFEKASELLKLGFQIVQINLPQHFIVPDETLNGHLNSLFSDKSIVLTVEEEQKIILSADGYAEQKLNLLGTEINGEKDIDWHLDYSSNYRFPERKLFFKIKPVPEEGVDIKLPWELSRFYHAPALSLAYRFTGNEKYFHALRNQIIDWIEKNSWKRGVNWACAMEVAIRACNWLLALDLSGNGFEKHITEVKKKKILTNLYLHGKHIFDNLEYYPTLTSNHYISDLLGLLYIGIYLPETPSSKKWRNFALRELEKEIRKQVYEDGADFEASICYHRLALEIFFYAALIAKKADLSFSNDYLKKLHKMFYFVLGTIKPDGKAPQIGDNDSGRIHILYPREVLDFSYLLTLGSIFFNDENLKVQEFELPPEVKILFSPNENRKWKSLKSTSIYELQSKGFKNSGIYVMRNKKDFLIISCGPNGQNDNGGHSHNDKLSFELQVNGDDLIVDPGTGVYTSYPEIRNIFRSTSSHNTVRIEREEQNGFYDWTVFSMQDDAKAICDRWEVDENIDIFEGHHSGYLRLSCQALHRRKIIFEKKKRSWLIEDMVKGKGMVLIEWFYNLHPEVNLKINTGKILLSKGSSEVELRFNPSNGLKVEIEDSKFSPEYGLISPTKKIRIYKKTKLPLKEVFELVVK